MVLMLVLEVAELVQVRAAVEELLVLVEVVLVRRSDRPGNVRNLLLLLVVMGRILGALQLLLLLLVLLLLAARCHFILLLRDLYPHSITQSPAIPKVRGSSNLANFTVSPKLGLLLLHNHHTRIANREITHQFTK